MLLFQTSREIIFYFQHFIQVCFYFLGKKTGGTAPPSGPSPCYGTDICDCRAFSLFETVTGSLTSGCVDNWAIFCRSHKLG